MLSLLLNKENIGLDKCVIDRVYDKEDAMKKPVMYTYIESKELGKKFYFANKETGQMVELSQEEFTKRFECYQSDLEKQDGIRPWEDKAKQIEEKSSGEIAEEGEER